MTPTLPVKHPRTFGRVKGRALKPLQSDLMQTLYPHIQLTPDSYSEIVGFDDVWFEIGFGAAEHLLWQAERHPRTAILGAEPYLNGAAKAVAGVDKLNLSNVRILNGDARPILDSLPDAALGTVFVLFPDPWPKLRHHKRRIISDDFIASLHRVIRPGGRFRFASDIIDYVDWSLTRIHIHGGFDFPARAVADWRTRPDDWPQTRFEQKAIREGRPCHYCEFIRR